ncbi:hypothetical protein KCU88_g2375, partial [Aureobasidium melanogenum]
MSPHGVPIGRAAEEESVGMLRIVALVDMNPHNWGDDADPMLMLMADDVAVAAVAVLVAVDMVMLAMSDMDIDIEPLIMGIEVY